MPLLEPKPEALRPARAASARRPTGCPDRQAAGHPRAAARRS